MVEVSERILYEQINAYLEEHDKLCKHQSRFRAINSTDIAVLEATDSWVYNIDFGKINAVIFVDLKKALDTVDHNILLSKLDPYGISGNLLKWLLSYLENRTRQRSVGWSLSDSWVLT